MTHSGVTKAKALVKGESDDQGRRLEFRKRLETGVVLAVNYADAVVSFWYCGREIK